MSAPPSRRRLLQAALAAPIVAGCRKTSARPATPVDPDVALRDAAIARERMLLSRYAGATTPALAAIRTDHEAHLRALGVDPAASEAPAVPANTPTTPAGLAAEERAAAAAHAADALRASRPLAAVLASLAASEASHPVALL